MDYLRNSWSNLKVNSGASALEFADASGTSLQVARQTYTQTASINW